MIIERRSGYANEEMVLYLNQIKNVQERYVRREFSSRIRLSTKLAKTRDALYDRKGRDAIIINNINESINYYSSLQVTG